MERKQLLCFCRLQNGLDLCTREPAAELHISFENCLLKCVQTVYPMSTIFALAAFMKSMFDRISAACPGTSDEIFTFQIWPLKINFSSLQSFKMVLFNGRKEKYRSNMWWPFGSEGNGANPVFQGDLSLSLSFTMPEWSLSWLGLHNITQIYLSRWT